MRKKLEIFCQKFIFGEQLLIFSIVLTPADLTDRDWSLIWSTPGDPPPMSLNGRECYINVKLSKVAAGAGSWFLQSQHSSHLHQYWPHLPPHNIVVIIINMILSMLFIIIIILILILIIIIVQGCGSKEVMVACVQQRPLSIRFLQPSDL